MAVLFRATVDRHFLVDLTPTRSCPAACDVMSYTTRFTPGTSFTMRLVMRASTSYGSRAQSAVIASSAVTARSATTCPYVRIVAHHPDDARVGEHGERLPEVVVQLRLS